MAVIIVGGGIGGLALALALARRGVRSSVFEQAPVIEPVGAGLQLGPNATRLLFELGLETPLRCQAVAPVRAEVRDAATGRLLLANRLGAVAEARWGAPYLVLTRAALQAMLLDAVMATPEVELHLGQAITSIDHGEGGALIGCDGLHSTVRASLFGQTAARFTGQTAWRGLARMDTSGPPVVQVWTGPRHHFVRYPVGEGLVNMVAVAESAQGDVEAWDQDGQGDRLAAEFAVWPEPVRATIAAVERPLRSALYDRAPLKRWSVGTVSLLGDAAHPMLPFLAQGAGMAIEDAWVAADLLSRHPPAEALKAYERARLARTAKAQAWATRNATLFHLPPRLATGLFGAARVLDRAVGADPEERFDWLYGWRP